MKMRAKLQAILASAVVGSLIGSATSARAALIAYEGFNYPTGDVANGTNTNASTNTKWVHAGTINPPSVPGPFNQVVSPGLISPLGGSSGNTASVSGQAGTLSDKLDFASSVTSGTLYYSLVLKPTSLDSQNGASTTGSYAFALTSQAVGAQTTAPAAAQVVAKIQMRRDASQSGMATGATKYNIGTANTNTITGTGSQWSTKTLDIADTEFVIVSYTQIAGTGNDVTNVWINPDISTFDPATTPVDATTTGNDIDNAIGIRAFFLRQTGGLPNTTQIDEIRVSLSASEVLPEPTSLSLLVGSACGLLARRRKRV